MTEYGRSPGSEPWHPGDPLYGDQGWEGQQQHYPHPQQANQYGQGYQDPYGQGGQTGQVPQGYEADPYQQQHAQQYQQQPQGYVDPQAQYQQQAQHHAPQQYQQSYEQQQQQQPQDHQQQQQQQYGTGYQGGYDTPGHLGQQYDGNWETGQAAMPYGGTPADPYGGQNPDLYGTPEAYPPPQPPGRRQNPPEPVVDWAPEEEARPEPEEEKHPFFTGEEDPDDDAYEEDSGRGRGSRGGDRDRERRSKDNKRKGKNGVACLVVALVLAGGVGGVGYFGYQFWQGKFGAAEDYAGSGSGDVQVEIPKGAFGNEIGNILKKAGVVKSVDAFVSAQLRNPKGTSIQAGVYTLKKEMSAESAVTMMLDPASQSNFVIPEGRRNVWVYEQIDKKLGLEPGTTKDIAKTKADTLGLPDWAKNHQNVKDPLEGFLFPASYPVAKGSKPEDALRKMVSRASQEYDKLELDAKAKQLGVDSPWQLVTIASLVQAEGTSHDDFRKMGEVVYNRLKPSNPQTYGGLEFDSTYNYIKNQSKLDLSLAEVRKYNSPYNTYFVKGLPPGPIGNPGLEALQGTLNPTHDGWYYFISLDGKSSKFTRTNAEHQKLVDEFNESRKN
ncbi:endolytic transglycosylase MltG [Streptomyces sp. adm13(2018)]|uniref:endolytic transglycosylase MltG n=1 Tax=unclassified Streptomyces TaxID=2593676 RepID=UPI0011CD4367|nr:endolytic transglycosylase MltG [Streptomyces sp. adm13(2018)]TXS14691.1 endolytic transglycosylase MltG [Streptomyces sp. adm13(2018)]